jgi:hypothetical protein
MEAIILKPKNKQDMKFIMELAKKTGIPAAKMSLEDFEDIALAELMKKERTGKTVSEATIMKKLQK